MTRPSSSLLAEQRQTPRVARRDKFLAVGQTVRDGQRSLLTLGDEVGKGGGGTVYRIVEQPQLVAKVYRAESREPSVAKVQAMLQMSWTGQVRCEQRALFPEGPIELSVVRDRVEEPR